MKNEIYLVADLTKIIEKLIDGEGSKLVLTRDGYECSENVEESDDSLELYSARDIQEMWAISRDPMDIVYWILENTQAWVQTAIDFEESTASVKRMEFLRAI